MSADLPSSNPFRRKGAAPVVAPSSTVTSTSFLPTLSTPTTSHIAFQHFELEIEPEPVEQADAPRKVGKKVRVQSPPPPSPSVPDSASTIGEDSYTLSTIDPTPALRQDDPFENVTSETDEDEEVKKAIAGSAESVFQNSGDHGASSARRYEREFNGYNRYRSSSEGTMDVDAFKRLLMTGNSGLGTPTPPTPHISQPTGDNGSSTDASSVSRQSVFDASQEIHGESPRTSHEISEPEDERRVAVTDFTSTITGRQKPPPPSSRHGRLIKVELRDGPVNTTAQSPNTPSSSNSQTYFSSSPRSVTDLNKPLPPAPARSSHDSDRESIFDREAAGKIPDPPTPSVPLHNKKSAPTPPLARRHSQLVSDSKLTRSNSGRLSPKPEEDAASIRSLDPSGGRPRSDSGRAPPPPPSRRPASIRGGSHNALGSPNPSHALPTPPPARGSSRTAPGRPPSIHNAEGPTPVQVKRSSMIAPPPPPPRHGRTSTDGTSPGTSRRPSGEAFRKSSDSARRGSTSSSLSQVESAIIVEPVPEAASSTRDVLADLNALQREIDALRVNQPPGKPRM